jgi:hypothetical protein
VFTDASKGLVSTGTLGADQGGTGVANNAAMTVTGSGNFAYTRTLTATTNVTFPTTGTLSTLAGSETLTNKTLTSPVISTISNTGSLTLPTSTDTIVGRATTDTLTNKTLTSPVIGGTPTGVGVLTSGTAVASTSGTSISFTALPSWVKRITIMLRSVSTSGTANPLFQLGTGSTTYTTSGYLGAGSSLDASTVSTAAFTAGFGLNISNAANVIHGSIVITNIDSNIWVANGVFARSDANTTTTGGSISLGAALTAVRVTTSNGTDTFDAGSINILYE